MTRATSGLPGSLGEPRSTEPQPDPIQSVPDPIQSVMEQSDDSSSPSGRLDPFGSGVHPGIPLESALSEFSSEVLERLAGRRGTFGRYQLEGELSQGGQGAVIRVWDEDLRRHLAMKVLRGKTETSASEGTTPVDPRSLGRFLEEAQVTGQLDHPGIVPIHELGLDALGRVYFTMKLVKGKTLKEVFELAAEGKEGWTTARVLSVLLKVCEAMAYAHHKGVVHRDLKPANVMIGRFGEVYVMDWGLARVLGRADRKDLRIAPHATTVEVLSDRHDRTEADSPLVTMDGHVVGTPAYMAPEQARGELPLVGPHSDVYSAGAMLYQLLAGHTPYIKPGMRLSSHAVWYRVQEGPPDPLRERAPVAPAELVAICEKAMKRDWTERYRDMGELAADLMAFLERRVVRAHETGAVAEVRKWIQRNRPLAWALGSAAGLLVSGLAVALFLKVQLNRSAALASERGERARQQETLRMESEETARRERTNVSCLSAFLQLGDLTAEADGLWPPHPDHIPDYDRWLQRARELVSSLEPRGEDIGHRARLTLLRERALPRSEDEREAERREQARFGELLKLQERRAALDRAQAVRRGTAVPAGWDLDESSLPSDASGLNALAWPLVEPYRREFGREAEGLALARLAIERVEDDRAAAEVGNTLAWALFASGLDQEALSESAGALAAAPEELRREFERYLAKLEAEVAAAREGSPRAQLEGQIGRLEAELSSLLRPRFAQEEDAWWYDQLEKLVAALETLSDPETGLIAGVSREHGLGVARRKQWAETVVERSLTGGAASRLWSEAIESIADPVQCPAYRGLRIEPQLGLLPLGRDPRSGLWEFAHVLSGEPARRGPEHRLLLTEASGLVLVLLPGGTFWMGAQKKDPGGRNYDPLVQENPVGATDESPVHPVTLSPFFLSKYEMTQAQWLRATGSNPSYLVRLGIMDPVEQVSWIDCEHVLFRMGLALPSEAQWEYAARAGTATPWWTGADPAELASAANLADAAARRNGELSTSYEEWDDGSFSHARVGSYAPNPFGLHDVLGNVWEWCRDGYDSSFYEHSPARDPVADAMGTERCVLRGASFSDPTGFARSAYRGAVSSVLAVRNQGVRPARPLEGRIAHPHPVR